MTDQAYFDNAATTYPKPEIVYTYADEVFRNYGVNVGRGDYDLAHNAEDIVSSSKENLKVLLHCTGKQIIYTTSATDALNRILQGLKLEFGDVVYISPFEHNAVTRILHHLENSVGIKVKILPFDSKTLQLSNKDMIEEFESECPKLVVLTHVSNVCGAILPVEDITKIAKQYGAITVIDMSQSAGLIDTNVGLETIDFAVFAGHKTLYSPFGIGGFVCKYGESRLSPVFYGGNGINSIEQDMPTDIVSMEEISSQNIYAIAGLKASTQWLLDEGITVHNREALLTKRLIGLIESFPNISIIASSMKCPRIGIVSCLFDGYSPNEISNVLNEQGISVRAGLHCAPTAHRFLGTLPDGTVRFSISALTKDEDFDVLEQALLYIQNNS